MSVVGRSLAVFLLLPSALVMAQPFPRGRALTSNTVGADSQPLVPTPGTFSLVIDEDFDLGGSIFKEGRPFLHNDGGNKYKNTALGLNAAAVLTPSPLGYGTSNTAVGHYALAAATTGSYNTALGVDAMRYGYSRGSVAVGDRALKLGGSRNVAIGYLALAGGVGYRNIGIGTAAGYLSTGSDNVAIGSTALRNLTTGTRNIGVGDLAGYSIEVGSPAGSTFSANIMIGNSGQAADQNTIRIGTSYIAAYPLYGQTRTFVAGIRDSAGVSSQEVCVRNGGFLVDNQLVPCPVVSSKRFKEDIRDLQEGTESVLDLRPVQFRYRKDVLPYAPDGLQYGLVAEEVAEVFPALVELGSDGEPYAVKYELLTSLLISELKLQRTELARQRRAIEALEGRLRAPGAPP